MQAFKLIWGSEALGPVRVDNYPNPARTYKSIALHVFDFEGDVIIEGSLSTNPSEDEWFTYRVETFTRPDAGSSKLQNRIIVARDRVIWMRARVESASPIVNGRKFGGRVDRVLVM